MPIEPSVAAALAAALLLMLSLLFSRRRGAGTRRRNASAEAVDTVAGWQPEAARVMTAAERQAFERLRQALPGHLVLAQVPLARFVRVPTQRSYSEWMQRVGSGSADLLVCDAGSRVLAVVDIRHDHESSRSRQRHERMGRVLKAAGIPVLKWHADHLPATAEVRNQFIPVLERGEASPRSGAGTPSKPLPLIPLPEIEEMLADGDAAYQDGSMEPVPSTLFDDFEPVPARR